MMWFQDLFVAVLSALVFACVIAKFVSVAFYGCDDYGSKVKVDANKVVKVGEHVNLGNALKVRESRSKKKVKFVDDVVVRDIDQLGFEEGGHEIGEEIKRVVFSGEEGVFEKGLGFVEGMILEGKNEKDDIFKCFDEQKVNEDGENMVYSDERSDEAFEREIIGKNNGIAIFDHNLSLEEEENVIIKNNTLKVEILKCVDEQCLNEEGKMLYTLEETFELGYYAQEDNLHIEDMDNLNMEEKVIKEETSTSGRVLEGLVVDDKVGNKGSSSQSRVDCIEDNLVERQGESIEGRLSERDEEEDRVEVQGENVEGGLSKKDEQRAMKDENIVIDEEDDDWEGIERTDLEKVFAEAVNYVEFGLQGKDDQSTKLGSDVQMQLYGLHKIAVEGACHQAQPMALNFFARAKWNAWQKLGSMSPEVAMEEYVKLLTEHLPEWVQHFNDEDGGQSSLESGISHDEDHRCSLQDTQPNLLSEPTKMEDN